MSFIIWHRGDCTIFSSKREKDAMDFIHNAEEEHPLIKFDGWQQSASGNNLVTILSNFDTVYQHDKVQPYLKASSVEGSNK